MTKEQQMKREEWRSHIDEQAKSGLSQIDFCKQHNLSDGKFGYYKSLLHPKQKVNAHLAPVKISAPSPASKVSDIRVTFPNGFQCLFSSDLNKEKLKAVLEVLLSC